MSSVLMKNLFSTQNALLCAMGCLILFSCVSASGQISAYMGDTITLQGYSYGGSAVYLFLTGPNLPINGVALQDTTARADEGHFTKVNVDGNDHWTYTWSTNTIAGLIDAGTYTVWVVNSPNDRSRLVNADYSTITIRLGIPLITLDSPTISGALALNTSPDHAHVEIDDIYRGSTPMTISRIEPGTYRVTFSKTGFSNLSATARVESGKTTEVMGTLHPLTGSLDIITNPSDAHILLDTTNRGTTPVTLSNLTAGNHTLTILKEKFITTEQQVTVFNGCTTEIRISLLPVSPPVVNSLPAGGPDPLIPIAAFIAGLLAIGYRKIK